MVYTQTQKNKFYEDEINSLVTRITALESFVQPFEPRTTDLEKALKESNDRIADLENKVKALQEDDSLE
jgi:predicted  nucleic acid-binding Zn-ribbon protein